MRPSAKIWVYTTPELRGVTRLKNQDVEGDLLFWQVRRWQVRVQACYAAEGWNFWLFPLLFISKHLTTILCRPLPNLYPRRTACLSRSGETLAYSRALGGLLTSLQVVQITSFCPGWVVHIFPSSTICSCMPRETSNSSFDMFSTIFKRWVHYMLHEPEPHILLFRCLQLFWKPWIYLINTFHRRPLPNKWFARLFELKKNIWSLKIFIGDAFERTYVHLRK